MTFRFGLDRGFDIVLAGAPEQRVHAGPAIKQAAILGTDLPGLRPRLRVAEGDRVAAGDILFTDRARPEIAVAAPVTGVVSAVETGARRMLSALVIAPDPSAEEPPSRPVDAAGDALRGALLSRGLWPAFRTRPFGRIPDPDAVPAAIFVTAVDTEPLAADPRVVLENRAEDFAAGVEALTRLGDGPVFVCQGAGADLVPGDTRITPVSFAGRHPAGLAGTHIVRRWPVTADRPVWTIGYQDAAAIGALLRTGRYPAARVVALCGPRMARPRLVRTCLGARLRDLTEDAITPGDAPARLLSGSVLSGREAAYLGRYDRQVTALDAPGVRRDTGLRAWFGRTRPGPAPVVPSAALERALPNGIPVVPLLRALSIGDAETARRLGALCLVEEDMALASSLCTSGADYGALLRRVLDELDGSA